VRIYLWLAANVSPCVADYKVTGPDILVAYVCFSNYAQKYDLVPVLVGQEAG